MIVELLGVIIKILLCLFFVKSPHPLDKGTEILKQYYIWDLFQDNSGATDETRLAKS